MGYDVKRFIGEIDEEFLCQICKMVLENPVQIPCDHLFCYECLKSRIVADRTCPVDLIPIVINAEVSVFKPPCVAFRNLLYKLNIMCDYQSTGCTKHVKLEHLVEHVKNCEYNSNAEVVCDKGCNLTVTRREYLMNDCCFHLKQEVVKLNRRVIFQRKRFEGLANCLYDRIKKLNEELVRHQTEKVQCENFIRRQQQEIVKLNENRPSIHSLKWQICHNMSVDDSNNLKIDDHNSSTFAFAQSYHPLKPAHSSFHIELSKSSENSSSVQRNLIWIGLTRKGHPVVRNPETGAIACIWNGRIQVDKECVANSERWEDGDVIRMGIKFPQNFSNDCSVVVCLHKNEKLLFEKCIHIPQYGFFPTICIYGRDTKVKFMYTNGNQ